jgi:hypothetical protein
LQVTDEPQLLDHCENDLDIVPEDDVSKVTSEDDVSKVTSDSGILRLALNKMSLD